MLMIRYMYMADQGRAVPHAGTPRLRPFAINPLTIDPILWPDRGERLTEIRGELESIHRSKQP